VALRNNGYMAQSSGVWHVGANAYLSSFPAMARGNMAGRMRNWTAGEGITSELVGIPSGHRHPSAWMMPQKAGALAARNTIAGSSAATISMAGGVNGEATIAGAGTLAGTAQLIISMVAELSGSGTISAAVAQAFLQLAAALTAGGSLSSVLTAIGNAEAALAGQGTVATTSAATALGTLAAEITSAGALLDTSNVGAAVWGAVAASNNVAGTMGEKLNDAGSASNPWTEVLESGFTAAQILRLIAAATQGNAAGLESGSPVFKSLDGSKNRITATYAAGTRAVTGRDAD
jgi:hypothetical protein